MASILAFQSGSVNVTSPGFRVLRTMRFAPADIAVSGSDFRLLRTTGLSFVPALVPVTGFNFNLKNLNPKLQFNPGDAHVTAPGFGMAPRARAAFPDLRPTRRRFVPAAFSLTAATTESGASSRRLWGSVGADARLELVFENIPDEQAEQILQLYDTATGGFLPLALPEGVLGGLSPELAGQVEEPDSGLEWHFEEAPKVQSVLKGVSTVNVNFIGRRVPKFNALPEPVIADCEIVFDDENGSFTCDSSQESSCGVRIEAGTAPLPEVCGTFKNSAQRMKSWVGFHSFSANSMDVYSPTRSILSDAGGGYSGGCCFDEAGNSYDMLIGTSPQNSDLESQQFVSFCKVSPEGEHLWEITIYMVDASSNSVPFYGGGLFDFSPTHLIGAFYWAFSGLNYIILLPKDGSSTNIRISSIAGLSSLVAIGVYEYGDSFILASGSVLARLGVSNTLSLSVLWAYNYTWTLGTTGPDASICVNRVTKDILWNHYSKFICFDGDGGFKWHRKLYFGSSQWVPNGDAVTSDSEGNYYAHSTCSFFSTPAYSEPLLRHVPFIIKFDKNGDFIKAITYSEGGLGSFNGSYYFYYYIKWTDDGRLIIAGEGSARSAFGMRIAEFSDNLEFRRAWVGTMTDIDNFDNIQFNDGNAAYTMLDWFSGTNTLLVSCYATRGEYAFIGMFPDYPPQHSVMYHISLDESPLTTTFSHPNVDDTRPITLTPVVGQATERPNEPFFYPSESDFIVYDLANNYYNPYFNQPVYQQAGSGLPEREIFQLSPDLTSWYNRVAMLTLNISWVSDYDSFSYNSTTVDPINVTSTFPIAVALNPQSSLYSQTPTVAVCRSDGANLPPVQDDEVLCQLNIDRPDFNFTDDKTGAVFTSETSLKLYSGDYRSERYGLEGVISGQHPRFDSALLTNWSVELDIYIPSGDVTVLFGTLAHIGNIRIDAYCASQWSASQFTTTSSGLMLANMGFDMYFNDFLMGSIFDVRVITNRWHTITLGVYGLLAYVRMHGEKDSYSNPMQSGDSTFTNGFNQGIFEACIPEPRITLGSNHSRTADIRGIVYSNLRYTRTGLHNKLPYFPTLERFPSVTRTNDSWYTTLINTLTGLPRSNTPGLNPATIAVSPIFTGVDGNSVIQDSGPGTTWTSSGATHTSFIGLNALDLRSGTGFASTDAASVLEAPFTIQFEFYPLPNPTTVTPFFIIKGDFYFLRVQLVQNLEQQFGMVRVDFGFFDFSGAEDVSFKLPMLSTPFKLREKTECAISIDSDKTVRIYINGACLKPNKDLYYYKPPFEKITFPITISIEFYRIDLYLFAFRLLKESYFTQDYTPFTWPANVNSTYSRPVPLNASVRPVQASDVLLLWQETDLTIGARLPELTNQAPPNPLYPIKLFYNIGTIPNFRIGASNWNTIFSDPAVLGAEALQTSTLPITEYEPFTVEFYAHVLPESTGSRRCLFRIEPFFTIVLTTSNIIQMRLTSYVGGSTPVTSISPFPYSVTVPVSVTKTATKQILLHVAGSLIGTVDASRTYMGHICCTWLDHTNANTDVGSCPSTYIGPIRITKYPRYEDSFNSMSLPFTVP